MFDDVTPEQIERYRRRCDSPANAELRRVVAALLELKAVAGAWADEHGDGCDCPFCDEPSNAGWAADDCRGLVWLADMAAASLGAIVYPGDPPAAADTPTVVRDHG